MFYEIANKNQAQMRRFLLPNPSASARHYGHLLGERMKLITLVLRIVGIAVAVVAAAQAPAQKPMFEVASIEPVKANSVRSGGSCHGKDSEFPSEQPHLMPFPPLGRCVFKAVTLHDLVRSAYMAELQDGIDDLITNEPAWMRSELFDVIAVAASPETTTRSELYAMLQTLLTDRFKLRLHRDHKEVQGYPVVVLVIDSVQRPRNN
jgi:hypothetical protein